tara:strand:- start:17 stop:262 length:246 start_codon:yes stop_codon:yes gene_type:complete
MSNTQTKVQTTVNIIRAAMESHNDTFVMLQAAQCLRFNFDDTGGLLLGALIDYKMIAAAMDLINSGSALEDVNLYSLATRV